MAAATLSIYDEAIGGAQRAREIIERRVREEVAAYNRNRSEHFYGLVQPADAERLLNGYRLKRPHAIDADDQSKRAIEAFGHNGKLVSLVGG
jgi:hypothetical protein